MGAEGFTFESATISTGGIFRAHVKGQTPLGLEARKSKDCGDFVLDNIANNMVGERLAWRGERDWAH